MLETKYNCTGRIVHIIPGSEDHETPWSDFVIIETGSEAEDEREREEIILERDSIDNKALKTSQRGNIATNVVVVALIMLIIIFIGVYTWKFNKIHVEENKDIKKVSNVRNVFSTQPGMKIKLILLRFLVYSSRFSCYKSSQINT